MSNSKTFTSNDWLSISSFIVLIFTMLVPIGEGLLIAFAVVFLAVGISSAVHNAEVIAERVGPSLGTLILAISVTVIEVALIVSLMSNDTADSPQIARDTVFAALMIVTNGIIGICILLGGLKHKELGFQSVGTTALLGVLAVLSTLTLILPIYTTTTNKGTYSAGQLIFVSLASLVLYGSLVWSQTKSHKNFFSAGENETSVEEITNRPTKKRAVTSFISLIFSLVAVVGLSKILSPTIESTISALGAPKAVVGIVIAILVLAPETLAAMNAAKINELQTSLNLALGSGAASIALTIPAVSLYSLLFDKPLTLGLDTKGIVFLMVTFLAGSFTFGSGRTTSLHGLIHLVIMASFLAISLMP
ncbi:calcium:proton antiporter [Leptospira bandrabouensis]|uniref:calcium:proton antiporter n=1 Tax=Leptospira bandrabouensis TaxID=2484903 RepID=UPI001EE8E5C4|nr:ionic transporter y4hA [Leptospira bandrabouensis]MCG6143572.1 ionic transporter y4hA [Leptospira bandrabouensis]MCG6151388.1 ionic transporter y4hA [Leptospira bandrabouensis]MCG6159232.1 ionic transporter y4hA [Leptospira bandrabouensis]MCG6163166.1 ionic transporter y4hA [Leptospira bandrabouensis]MCW7460257.1 ionic transporter y4hA [Leptospira bandrabouensis]